MKHILLIALLFTIYFLCAFSCNARGRHPRQTHSNDSTIKSTNAGIIIYPNSIYYNQSEFSIEPKEDNHDWLWWIPFIVVLLLAVYFFHKATRDEEVYWPDNHNDSDDDSGYPNSFNINTGI